MQHNNTHTKKHQLLTTVEMFSIKVMMKYDDGFQWVGLKL